MAQKRRNDAKRDPHDAARAPAVLRLACKAFHIRSLGFHASVTDREPGRLASIDEVSCLPAAMDRVAYRVGGTRPSRAPRAARSRSPDRAGDEASLDLLAQRAQVPVKTACMLRSLPR